MSERTAAESRERRFTGWHMLCVVCAFFAVVIGVNVTLAVFASQSWTGLVVKNSYVASQEFNGHLAEARAQAALHWHDTLDYAGGQLSFTLADEDRRPLTGFAVQALARRPVHEGEDRVIDLVEGTSGTYRAAVNLAAGLWEIEVLARNSDGNPYRRQYRFEIEDQGQ